MTDQPDPHREDRELERELAALPEVDADPQFRERLRAEFVTGRLPVPAEPALVRRVWWPWVAAAAAALFIVAGVNMLNSGPTLYVIESSGSGEVGIGAETADIQAVGAISDAIVIGAELSVPATGALDLIVPEVALYEVAAGTRMTLPASPGRWFGRSVSCSLFVGELRLKTGPRFAGATLQVYTPDGMVRVTGTLLSVQCDSSGTCVCVLEGTARVGTDETDLEEVAPGFRKIMMKDGTVDIIPVKQMHKDAVLDFDRRVGGHMHE